MCYTSCQKTPQRQRCIQVCALLVLPGIVTRCATQHTYMLHLLFFNVLVDLLHSAPLAHGKTSSSQEIVSAAKELLV